MTLKKLHYLSGITLSSFIALHLFNHLYSIWGIDKHIALMNLLRVVYRNGLVETLLLVAVLTQIVSGIKLFSRKRAFATTFFEQLQIQTGLYLAFFLLIHISAVFVGRYYLHLDTNFYFGAAGINIFPLKLFFIPYYALAIMAVFGHLAAVHRTKTKTIVGLTPNTQAKIILTLGLALTIAIFYGLTNHFKGVVIP
jgi:hypothetical protein